MKSVYLLFTVTILLSLTHAQTITIATNPVNSTPTYTDYGINLSTEEDPIILTEIYQSYLALNQTEQLSGKELIPTAALKRLGEGEKLYFLYFDTVENGEPYQYEGVISVANVENETVYNVVSVRSEKIIVSTAPANTTLSSFLDTLVTKQYSRYTPTQASADPFLAEVQKAIKENYPIIAGTILTAVYISKSPEANGYYIFYLGTAADSISLWRANAFNDKSNTFIASFERVQVPSSVKK